MSKRPSHDLHRLRRDVQQALTSLSVFLRRLDREISSTLPAPEKFSSMVAGSETEKVEIIKRICADFFHVHPDRISAHDRRGRIALARQCTMVLAYDHTRLVLQEIGDAIGGFDHGTVIFARQSIFERIETDAIFKEDFEHLRQECLDAIKPKDHAA